MELGLGSPGGGSGTGGATEDSTAGSSAVIVPSSLRRKVGAAPAQDNDNSSAAPKAVLNGLDGADDALNSANWAARTIADLSDRLVQAETERESLSTTAGRAAGSIAELSSKLVQAVAVNDELTVELDALRGLKNNLEGKISELESLVQHEARSKTEQSFAAQKEKTELIQRVMELEGRERQQTNEMGDQAAKTDEAIRLAQRESDAVREGLEVQVARLEADLGAMQRQNQALLVRAADEQATLQQQLNELRLENAGLL